MQVPVTSCKRKSRPQGIHPVRGRGGGAEHTIIRTRGICMLVSAIILTWSWSSSASWYISLRRLGTTRRTAPEPVLAPHTRPSSAALFDVLDTPGRGKIIRESSSARTQKHPKNGQQKEKLQPARGDATHNSMTFHIPGFSAKCGGRGVDCCIRRLCPCGRRIYTKCWSIPPQHASSI